MAEKDTLKDKTREFFRRRRTISIVLLVFGIVYWIAVARPRNTSLLNAVEWKNHAWAAKLLARGADPDVSRSCTNLLGHRTGCCRAIICAAGRSDYEMVKLLVDYGANVNKQGPSHGTAITAAAGSGNIKVVKLLLENGARPDAGYGYMYRSPLMAAVRHEDPTIASLLLEHGANIEYRDHHKDNAMTLAVFRGREKSVRLLAKHGADVNQYMSDGKVPLLCSAAFDEERSKVLATLLELGADVNSRSTDDGTTPLMLASYKSSYDSVALLVQNGAVVNAVDETFTTPISYSGTVEITELLLRHGADPFIENTNRENALDIALKYEQWEVADYLLDIMTGALAAPCNLVTSIGECRQ